jgi:hypothetical protein
MSKSTSPNPWCQLVMAPAGAGMSMATSLLLAQQAASGAAVSLVDVGQSTRAIRTTGPWRMPKGMAEPKNKPFYRQFDKRAF